LISVINRTIPDVSGW